MKTLERGQDKIKKICDTLRKETLEPAEKEAFDIIEAAKIRAAEIITEADNHAKKIVASARENIEQERFVFNSSLQQAAKQSLETLRQSIERDLFQKELYTMVQRHTSDPKIIARLVDAIVSAIETQGIDTELTAIIPKTVPAQELTALLAANVLERLKKESIVIGTIAGGVQIQLKDKNVTLDFSDTTLKELLSAYVRKDLRKLFFGGV